MNNDYLKSILCYVINQGDATISFVVKPILHSPTSSISVLIHKVRVTENFDLVYFITIYYTTDKAIPIPGQIAFKSCDFMENFSIDLETMENQKIILGCLPSTK